MRRLRDDAAISARYHRGVTAGDVARDVARDEERSAASDAFAATDLGRLLTLFGRLPLALLVPVVGFDCLERCERDGHIRIDVAAGSSIALVSSLVGASDQVPGVVRHQLVERLADVLAGHDVVRCPPDVARAIGLALVEARVYCSDHLVRAIRSALILVDYEAASTMLAFARSHDGASVELMHLQSMLLEASGEHGAALVVANDVDAANDPTWLGRWASNLFLSTGTVAPESAPESDDPNNEYAASLAWVHTFTGDVLGVAAAVSTVIDDPRSSPQAVLWSCVVGSFTAALNGRSAVATRLLDLGDSILEVHGPSLTPFAGFQMRAARLLVLTRIGQLADARRMTAGPHLGPGFEAAAVRRFGALASRESGHPNEALDLITADSGPIGGDPFRFQPWIDSEADVCRALLGEPDTQVDESIPSGGLALYESCLRRNRGWVLAAQGRIDDARSAALDAFELAGRRSQQAMQLLAALDIARFGQAHRALELLVDVDGDGPVFTVGAAAVVALADDDVDHLIAAARVARRCGFDLLASELGARAQGSPSARYDQVLRARIELAAPSLLRLRTPLLQAAPRPGLLTGREVEVATLAGCGSSSQVVAAQLAVSVRTVDNLLGKVYMKAGLSGRSELGSLLRGDLGAAPRE